MTDDTDALALAIIRMVRPHKHRWKELRKHRAIIDKGQASERSVKFYRCHCGKLKRVNSCH